MFGRLRVRMKAAPKTTIRRVAVTSGLARKQVASDFGIGFLTLSRWVQQDRKTLPEAIEMKSDEILVEADFRVKIRSTYCRKQRCSQILFVLSGATCRRKTCLKFRACRAGLSPNQ